MKRYAIAKRWSQAGLGLLTILVASGPMLADDDDDQDAEQRRIGLHLGDDLVGPGGVIASRAAMRRFIRRKP